MYVRRLQKSFKYLLAPDEHFEKSLNGLSLYHAHCSVFKFTCLWLRIHQIDFHLFHIFKFPQPIQSSSFRMVFGQLILTMRLGDFFEYLDALHDCARCLASNWSWSLVLIQSHRHLNLSQILYVSTTIDIGEPKQIKSCVANRKNSINISSRLGR